MKKITLKPPTPIRATVFPENTRAVLPPENPNRKQRSADFAVSEMPKKFTFVLVDEIAEAVKISKGKARKLIARGKVAVNGEVVYDPDLRVDDTAKVECWP